MLPSLSFLKRADKNEQEIQLFLMNSSDLQVLVPKFKVFKRQSKQNELICEPVSAHGPPVAITVLVHVISSDQLECFRFYHNSQEGD